MTYTLTKTGAEIDTALGTTLPAKADKVTSPTAGNLAGLDAEGNLVDSGIDKDTPEFDSIILTNGQIVFPATQNASSDPNTLDDYEEGTWTPALYFGGASTGITYASGPTGKYIKIGNLVFVTTQFDLTSKGTATGNAVVGGFPFSSSVYQSFSVIHNNTTFANQWAGRFVSTVLDLFEVTEAGVNSYLTNANFANNSSFYITGVYTI